MFVEIGQFILCVSLDVAVSVAVVASVAVVISVAVVVSVVVDVLDEVCCDNSGVYVETVAPKGLQIIFLVRT